MRCSSSQSLHTRLLATSGASNRVITCAPRVPATHGSNTRPLSSPERGFRHWSDCPRCAVRSVRNLRHYWKKSTADRSRTLRRPRGNATPFRTSRAELAANFCGSTCIQSPACLVSECQKARWPSGRRGLLVSSVHGGLPEPTNQSTGVKTMSQKNERANQRLNRRNQGMTFPQSRAPRPYARLASVC